MFRTLGIAASGLSAQRQRMEIAAQNIANADVPNAPDGSGYKRRTVRLETATQATAQFGGNNMPGISGTNANAVQPFGSPAFNVPALEDSRRTVQIPVLQPLPTATAQHYGVAVTGIAEDASGTGRLAYEPGHPDADAN